MLWLRGIPGCGKTILISTIFRHLDNDNALRGMTGLVCHFFDFQEDAKRQANGLLLSIISQLASGYCFRELEQCLHYQALQIAK